MGVMDDEFVGPAIWVFVAVVSFCVLACVCNCMDNCIRNMVNARWDRQREEEYRKRREEEFKKRSPDTDPTDACFSQRPVLAYELVRQLA